MKLLKEYKDLLEKVNYEYTEKDPEFYGIENYTWNNGLLDVDGDVNFPTYVPEIPFKFGKVSGDFNCSMLNLKYFKNCPIYVGGLFYGTFNKIKDLVGAPREVGGGFVISFNPYLDRLKGFPRKVGGSVSIYKCARVFDKEEIRRRCDVGGFIHVLSADEIDDKDEVVRDLRPDITYDEHFVDN
jgi:hypothetical protein